MRSRSGTLCAASGRLLLAVLVLAAALPLAGREVDDPVALNVSIRVFDPGIPDDRAVHRDLEIFPRIRAVEATILPFLLREELVASDEWGAVRVVPESDAAAELLVLGRIQRSDGERIVLQITAVDASGRTWLDSTFEGSAARDYAEAGPGPMYAEINRALLAARDELDGAELSRVIEISMLRYAATLAPSAFSPYLEQGADGRFQLRRLPARDDPMLARIRRLRSMEYVITDAIDEKYRELSTEITAVYDLWREYRRKSLEYRAEDARFARQSRQGAPIGSYESLQAVYDAYKWGRITEQELDELAVAFANEAAPIVADAEARIAELGSWADERYGEWNRILEELFEIESEIGPTGQ